MNLDDISKIQRIDQGGMLEKIHNLPSQIQSSWSFVLQQQTLDFPQLNEIFFAGLSFHENIIEILQVMVSECKAEIFSLKNQLILPKNCKGKEKLLVLLVNTENVSEMKNLMNQGIERNCTLFMIFNNQLLKETFLQVSVPNWVLNDHSFSRTTLGFDTFILYGILNKAGLEPDITEEIKLLIRNLEKTIQHNGFSVPASTNPAKRLAGQMVGRWLKIVAGGLMLPVANCWSDQINKSAKALCSSEDIFHLVLHSLSGVFNPEKIVQQSMVIFLKSGFNDLEIENLADQVKIELMCNGLGTDTYSARGDDRLSQIWTTILFGDFLAYYLAIAYECDPTPIALLS
jgi:glucose/mannose-6-phosphate isomerase